MNIFKNGKFELFSLTETERERYQGWGVTGIIAGVQEMERTREGVAILLNDMWHSAVVNFGCVSSRILLIKFTFLRVKVCVVVGYGPNEGYGE